MTLREKITADVIWREISAIWGGGVNLLSYLKRWIKGLDENVLAKFLRFSTSSDVILCEAIAVTFTSLVGKGRRPIFHTCGSVIELPATYEDFCDFREEWCGLM